MRLPREEQRLIPESCCKGCRPGIDPFGLGATATVPSGEDVYPDAGLRKELCQRDYERSLAGTASRKIADTDDRAAQLLLLKYPKVVSTIFRLDTGQEQR
jgi:hypothetical protein